MADERETRLLGALQRWLDGTVAGDADALAALLEDEYTFTHATSAHIDTREEWLESFRSGRRRYKSWTVAEVTPRLYPGAAVITGRGHQEVVRPSGEIFVLRTSFLCAWIERVDGWRLAGWAATQLPE